MFVGDVQAAFVWTYQLGREYVRQNKSQLKAPRRLSGTRARLFRTQMISDVQSLSEPQKENPRRRQCCRSRKPASRTSRIFNCCPRGRWSVLAFWLFANACLGLTVDIKASYSSWECLVSLSFPDCLRAALDEKPGPTLTIFLTF